MSVVVLQNPMDLLKGECGSSNKTCVSSILDVNEVNDIEAEMVSNMTEEEDREPRAIPVIKTEPEVSVVPVVIVTHLSNRLYPELPVPIEVCPCGKKLVSSKWISSAF
jgi:hypothetical protein